MKHDKGVITGRRRHWDEEACSKYGQTLGYNVVGRFTDHPEFSNQSGYTSLVMKERLITEHDYDYDLYDVWEIETLNSMYTFLEYRDTE